MNSIAANRQPEAVKDEEDDDRWSPMMADEYDEEFFRELRDGSRRSATVIVPLVVNLIRPRSVVDVGCGTGASCSA